MHEKKNLVKSLLFVSVRVGLPCATVTSISNLSAFYKEVIFYLFTHLIFMYVCIWPSCMLA